MIKTILLFKNNSNTNMPKNSSNLFRNEITYKLFT